MTLRSENPDQTAANPQAARAQMRQRCLDARAAMTPAAHAAASERIGRHLAAVLNRRPPGILGFCWPIRREFDARPLVTQLLAAGWQACLPALPAPAAPMVFHRWTPGCPMAAGRHGIPVPADPCILQPDTLLLPLVAFDDAGFRLGYGGGYFDRTLAARVPRPLAVGVGFELGRVASILPQDHDLPLDTIVTEAGIFPYPRRACGMLD